MHKSTRKELLRDCPLVRRAPVFAFSAALIAFAPGCLKPHTSTPPRPAPSVTGRVPSQARLCPAAALRSVLSPFPHEYHAVLFRERPGLVSYRLEHQGTLAATLVLSDLGASDSSEKAAFRLTPQRLQNFPLRTTAMGVGEAVLVADRFVVEVDALAPFVGDTRRRVPLSCVDLKRLARLATPQPL